MSVITTWIISSVIGLALVGSVIIIWCYGWRKGYNEGIIKGYWRGFNTKRKEITHVKRNEPSNH